MSPRKNNVITIEAWPKLGTSQLYSTKVKGAHIAKKSNLLHVTLENLDPCQLGRMHEIDLPLPARLGNKTCVFFQACGLEADTTGKRICLDQVAGVAIGLRFRGVTKDDSEEFEFEKLPLAPDPSTTKPQSQASPKSSSEDTGSTPRNQSQIW